MTDHTIRIATPSDHPFVLDSWRKSYRETRKRTEIDAGFTRAHRMIAATLVAECTLVIAVPLDEATGEPVAPDAISGWAIGDPLDEHLLVHYVYVKNAYRKHGLARRLFADLLGRVKRTGHARDRKPHEPHVVITSCTDKWIGNMMRRHGWGFAPNVPFYRAICRQMDMTRPAASVVDGEREGTAA